MNAPNLKQKTGNLKVRRELPDLLSSFQFQVSSFCEAPMRGFFVIGAVLYES
jgi:hypothetical protein